MHEFGAGGGLGNVFEARRRGVARRIDRPEARRGAGRLDLGARPENSSESRRPNDDRRRQPHAEQFDRLVARRRAAQHFRQELDFGQRLLVAAHGDLVAGRAVDQIEKHARQARAGKLAHRPHAVASPPEFGCVHQTLSITLAAGTPSPRCRGRACACRRPRSRKSPSRASRATGDSCRRARRPASRRHRECGPDRSRR